MNKNYFFFLRLPALLFLFYINSNFLLAQCPEGTLFFKNQIEIDSFASNYPDCSHLKGDLYISNSDNSGDSTIKNLNGLENLKSAYSISIENTNLINLDGLENLTTLTDYKGLKIDYNELLENITALKNLETLNGSLNIYKNNALTNLQGLEKITHIGYNLNLFDNPKLVDLSSLKNLKTIGTPSLQPSRTGELSIEQNHALRYLSGLDSLTAVSSLVIRKNNQLETLDGINNIHQVSAFEINENPSLVSISALSNITSVWGITIGNNKVLTSLTGIENIDLSKALFITISGNESLSNCQEQNICDYIQNGGSLDIPLKNAAGCNNNEEVLIACNETQMLSAIHEIMNNKITAYPNPTTTQLFIQQEEKERLRLSLYDMMGRKILEEQMSNSFFSIDLSYYTTGFFILEVESLTTGAKIVELIGKK